MIEAAQSLNDQAVKLAHNGEYKEAIACILRAITLEKNNYLLWFNLGITYRDAGKLSEARKALEFAYDIEESEADEDVIESLALVCFELGEFEDALYYCKEGLEYNVENPHLWNTTGVVYFNQAEYSDAAEAFETAVMLNPYYYDALYNLRDTYKELNNKAGYQECNERMKLIKGFQE